MLAVVVVIAIVAVSLAAMPTLNEAFAKNPVPELENKGKQGEKSSESRRPVNSGTNCPKCSDGGYGIRGGHTGGLKIASI